MSGGRRRLRTSNTYVVNLAIGKEGRKMVEVRIPPPEAYRVADILSSAAFDLQEIRNDLFKSLNNLRNRWRGDAEQAYAAGFEKRLNLLNDRVKLLLAIAEALRAIARAGEEADRAGKAVAP